MKKIETIIDSIKKCNMSYGDKEILIAILKEEKTDYTGFLIAFSKIVGVASDVFGKFDLDVGELIDKLL
jgi:hypothetical protein